MAALVGTALVLLGAACGGGSDETGGDSALPGAGKPAITLGTKDFPEEFILGELYKQALEAQGYTVNLKKNIGPTEIVDGQLQAGEIDAYPEYMGVAVTVVAGDDRVPKTAEDTYEIAKRFYAERGQELSAPTPFSDTDAVATTRAFAARHHLESLSDLKGVGKFTLGARPEFGTRLQGLVGLRQVYGLTNARFVPLAQGIAYDRLDAGAVDTIGIFTTDSQLAGGDYVVLEDPKRLFAHQQVALVVDRQKLEALGGDAFLRIVDRVSSRLTAGAIIGLNEAVVVKKEPEEDVAHDFLDRNGLLGS